LEVSVLKTELTLQEKLRDLRDERKMTRSDLAGATGIPLSTLQRMEGKDDIRTGIRTLLPSQNFTAFPLIICPA